MVINRHKFMGSEAGNVPLVLFEEAVNYILNRINVLKKEFLLIENKQMFSFSKTICFIKNATICIQKTSLNKINK